jgi:hypothetical protein
MVAPMLGRNVPTDYEPSVLSEVISAQKAAQLPAWSRPLTDLLKKWVVTGVLDARATSLAMDAAEDRGATWASALHTILERVSAYREGIEELAPFLREHFYLQISAGPEQASAWRSAMEKCEELRDSTAGDTFVEAPEMFCSLDSDQKKRKKKLVDQKKKKTVAAYEARSLVQHVINETYNSGDSDVVSVPASPTAAAEVDRQLAYKTKPTALLSTTEAGSSCTSSTEDGEGRAARRPVDPEVEELRLQLYAALKLQDATKAVERFKASLGRPLADASDDRIVLHNHAEIAFHCLSNADWCRLQLWRAYSSGLRTQVDEVLSQAQLCQRGFPEMVSKAWCPRTGADVLGYIATSVPSKLLRSLIKMVEGRPQFLRDLERKAEMASRVSDEIGDEIPAYRA